MTRCRLFLFILFVAFTPAYGQTSQQKPKPEPWYDRVLRSINPEDIDYGAIFEERKRAFRSLLGSRCFQFSLASTATAIWLMTMLWVQYISNRRKMDIAVDSIADVLRHDQYSRQVARNAIRRYNDHIESCNRVIEAEQTGLWQWTSTSELKELNEKVDVTHAEVKRLEAELEAKATLIAEMSLRCPEPVAPNPDLSVHAKLIDRINQLEHQIMDERKKNQRLKGTALDARNT
jgi:hypothetical protein